MNRLSIWRLLGLVLIGLCALPLSARAGNWPQWRGPEGNSVSREASLPLVWRESFNIGWKVELPGWGNSTPIVWGDVFFVTSQQDDKLLLVRLEKKTGKVVWTREVGRGTYDKAAKPKRGQQVFHRLQNLASP